MITRIIKKAAIMLFVSTQITAYGQSALLPGNPSIDRSLLKAGRSSMSYTIDYNGQWIELDTYTIDITKDTKHLKIHAVLKFNKSDVTWTDNFVADAATFKPVSSFSDRDERTITLSFGQGITGEHTDKKTGKKTPVSLSVNGSFFDYALYPYLLQALPLDLGYKTAIPVYDYEAKDNSRLHNVIIRDVRSDVYISALTGEHTVWKVSAFEENTGHNFEYLIDKKNRRIRRINIVSAKGDRIIMTDKETDLNPLKHTFNKEETMAMINDGRSTIKGAAFARDNENEGLLKGMAVLNIHKKQYAAKGTKVVLIPYTTYYKEWLAVNKKQSKIKNARPVPLPQEARDCIKTATVYDDEGRFEFTDLKPGEYLLITVFGYTHTSNRTEETGRASVYVGGVYQGDEVYTGVFSYSSNASASIQKVVTIQYDGEQAEVKLRKIK